MKDPQGLSKKRSIHIEANDGDVHLNIIAVLTTDVLTDSEMDRLNVSATRNIADHLHLITGADFGIDNIVIEARK